MLQLKARIIANQRIKGPYSHSIIQAPALALQANPGQFLQVKVGDAVSPLLRRPFGVHGTEGQKVKIMYEVVGPATTIFSNRQPGDYLDVIGPLGNGFNLPPITCHLRPILVAGGMGVAPLVFLAEKLTEGKSTKLRGKSLVLIGARTKDDILCEKEFKKLGCDVKIATDDGSRGFKGKVTELLNKILRENEKTRKRENEIYACGPRPMLKEISRSALQYNVPAQVSLEEHLACGIGACLGCVIETRYGYKRVCKDGPVFDARDIIWD